MIVFHAGTKLDAGKVLTNGGRVLGLSAFGGDIDEARAVAYQAVEEVEFKDKQFRTDIGIKK